MRATAILLLVLGACGADGDYSTGDGHDAGPAAPDAPQCVPITDEHCYFGERCGWIHQAEGVDADAWRFDCVPGGSNAEGQGCGRGAIGPHTGYDNCASGLVCVDNSCRRMCTLTPDGCRFGQSCVNPNDGVAIGPSTEFGICEEP